MLNAIARSDQLSVSVGDRISPSLPTELGWLPVRNVSPVGSRSSEVKLCTMAGLTIGVYGFANGSLNGGATCNYRPQDLVPSKSCGILLETRKLNVEQEKV